MIGYRFRAHAARLRRGALGLTAAQVAERIGVTESAVCAFERETDPREPSNATYLLLCAALGVDDDALREPIPATTDAA